MCERARERERQCGECVTRRKCVGGEGQCVSERARMCGLAMTCANDTNDMCNDMCKQAHTCVGLQ